MKFFLVKSSFSSVMSSNADGPRISESKIRSHRTEKLVYVSIGCSVEEIRSVDQQFPAGLEKYFSVRPSSLWVANTKNILKSDPL